MVAVRKASEVLGKLRRKLAPPPNILPSEWANEFRRLSPESSARPGRFRIEKTPFMRDPLKEVKAFGEALDRNLTSPQRVIMENSGDIRQDKSVEEFQRHIFENAGSTPGVSTAQIGLTEKESQRFSLDNIVQGLINNDLDKRAAFEMEVSNAAQDSLGRSRDRIAIPTDILLRGFQSKDERFRDVVTVSASGASQNNSASNLVATELLDELFVESLREHSGILSKITMIPGLTGDVEIPIELLNPDFYWVGEEEAPTEGNYTLGGISLEFKSVGAAVPFSRRAGKQTTPQTENVLANSLRKGLAIALAKGAIISCSYIEL